VDGMQNEENVGDSFNIKRPLAVRALRRSNVRKKIAEYLFEISPSCSYTSEIAYHVGATSSNVIGALRGMNARYREDESLISLELVEEKSGGKNIRLYALTNFGKEIIDTIHNKR
jgi:predicted transcriptional regulator with HTH domain